MTTSEEVRAAFDQSHAAFELVKKAFAEVTKLSSSELTPEHPVYSEWKTADDQYVQALARYQELLSQRDRELRRQKPRFQGLRATDIEMPTSAWGAFQT